MRGHFVRTEKRRDPALRLVAAMIRQALLDARRGRAEAAEWLDTTGQEWAAVFLRLDITDWRACDPLTADGQARRAAQGPLTWAQRVDKYGQPERRRRRAKGPGGGGD